MSGHSVTGGTRWKQSNLTHPLLKDNATQRASGWQVFLLHLPLSNSESRERSALIGRWIVIKDREFGSGLKVPLLQCLRLQAVLCRGTGWEQQ